MQLINDLSLKLDQNADLIDQSIQRVVASGWLVLGPEVARFESLFADYNEVDHCVGLANGTDAIELGLRALGVTDKSVVATVANAGGYTTIAVNTIGANLLYMDVDPDTQNVTINEVEKAIDLGATAVVVTHLFGLAVGAIAGIASLCSARGVRLLEDCAQAHGARVASRCVGSFGDLASFSFYPTKNLGALGDGGAIVTTQKDLADRVRQLRQYGWSEKYRIDISNGRNSRLDELQAAILGDFLPHLDDWNAQRRLVAARYNADIRNAAVTLPNHDGEDYVAHLYVLRCENRRALQSHMKSHQISTDIHYPIPDHRQTIIKDQQRIDNLPVTELLAQQILTLPCYPGMSDQQIEHVIRSVNSWQT